MTIIGRNSSLGRNVRGGRGAQFNPLALGGCVAWFDMQDPSSYTQAGTVTAITNKATNVSWTEPTNPPAYSATALNGYPAMDFNGTTSRIQSTTDSAVISLFGANAAYTVFYVAKFDTVDRSENLFNVANSGSNSGFRGFGQNTTGSGCWLFNGNNGGSVNLDSTGASNSNINVFEWYTPDGLTLSLNVNGGAPDPNAGSANVGTISVNRASIGNRPRLANDSFFDGKLGELLIFNRQLSSAERALVNIYLSLKWGVGLSPVLPLRIVSSSAALVYLSADVGTTISTGVSAWADQSGNGRNATQGTAGSQPVLNATGLGGKGIITFDGVDDFLTIAWIPPAPGTTPTWYWCVFNTLVSGTGATVFASNNTNRHRLYWANASSMQMNCGAGANNGARSAATWYRADVLFNNNTTDYRKIGSAVVTGDNAGNNAGSTAFTLGANNNTPSSPTNTAYAAFGAWPAEPTADEKRALDMFVYAYWDALVQI